MQTQTVEKENQFSYSEEKFKEIVRQLSSGEIIGKQHGEVESLLKTEGFELLRRLMQDHLDLRSERETAREVVGVDGIARPHARATARQLEMLFGTVSVGRMGYSNKGVSSLHPLDGELNLSPDLYSHGVRRQAAAATSKESFDEVVTTLELNTGARVAKRQVEELAVRAAADFDAFYLTASVQTAQQVAETSSVLVLTTDAKGVVMRTQDLREATRKAAEARTPKLDKRLSRGEKRNAKRMAQVASVYTIKPYIRTPEQIVGQLHPLREVETKRPRPEQKRVWASLEKQPADVIVEVFDEALNRDPDKTKQWVAVVDGNETQLELLQAAASLYGISLTIILDLIHVLEYLWKAAYVFNEKESKAAQSWVSERLLAILCGRASQVAAGIRRSATLSKLTLKQREAADDCADYLLKYAKFLRYDQYLAQGFPIASGVIEGACRYLVKDRMDLTGARWRLKGAEAVLKLRSLRASADFDAYWHFHLQMELRRNHFTKYAGKSIPLQHPFLSKRGNIPALKLLKEN